MFNFVVSILYIWRMKKKNDDSPLFVKVQMTVPPVRLRCVGNLGNFDRDKNWDNTLKNTLKGRYKRVRMMKVFWKNNVENWYKRERTMKVDVRKGKQKGIINI